ncbi:MAG: DUF3429 domain-containing protein [Acetobacteraceae bacterium]
MAARDRIPPTSLILGIGAMCPIILAAVAAWTIPERTASLAVQAACVWAGSILAFLGGARRGLSFRGYDDATWGELASSGWLFGLGLLALFLPWTVASLALLVVGYLSVGVLDPAAARSGQAPAFFARLRPMQAAIAVTGLLGLAAFVLAQK